MKTGNRVRGFTSLHEAGADAVLELVALARQLKQRAPEGRPLLGRSIALCFMNPSLRTQTAFSVAAAQLGAHPVTLTFGAGSWALEAIEGVVMDSDKPEHAKDAARVLSGYVDAIALRSFPAGKEWAADKAELLLSAFKRWARVPVINLESALGHPCQALADLMTIQELRPRARKFVLAWTPHVKALPLAVAHSAAEIAAMAGMDVTLLRPEGYDLDADVMRRVAETCGERGRSLTVTDDQRSALRGAEVVYAKSWGGLSNYGTPPPQDGGFRRRWEITPDTVALTANAILLHCLPVRRNVEVSDEALDGPSSAVYQEADNRLHTAKAVLLSLLEEP